MESLKYYKRIEDMSPDGTLTVLMQEGGDIIVNIRGYEGSSSELTSAQVEFCTVSNGGGRSPHTRAALIALAKAIEKDNTENPI